MQNQSHRDPGNYVNFWMHPSTWGVQNVSKFRIQTNRFFITCHILNFFLNFWTRIILKKLIQSQKSRHRSFRQFEINQKHLWSFMAILGQSRSFSAIQGHFRSFWVISGHSSLKISKTSEKSDLELDSFHRDHLPVWANSHPARKVVNPQAVGMAVARPLGFEIDFRGHFTANKIQNVTNVKFRSLALVFNS